MTQYAERGRRATFHTTGLEHSPPSAIPWERTPWHATQRAARTRFAALSADDREVLLAFLAGL